MKSSWAALALLISCDALAQAYLIDGPNPVVFAPLPTTATRLTVPSFSGATVTLPFTFSFYGQPVTQAGVSLYGYLVLAGGSAGESTNTAIPQVVMGSIPSTFIAPWWDGLTEGGTYRWLVSGAAPFRDAAFEWAATGGVFQVQLFESTGQIRFVYGPVAPSSSLSASIGIQRQLGVGIAGVGCTPGCAGTDWASALVNKAIDFYTPADLRVVRSSADAFGYAGVSYRASATIRNEGGHVATNVTVRFYVSTDANLDVATDLALGDAVIAALPALGEQTASTSTLAMPAALLPGGYFIFAVVDPSNAILETNDSNNVGSPLPMQVATGKGDAVITAMVPPSAARPGEVLTITRTIRNAGNAALGAFTYTWLLSDNLAVSVSDLVLGNGMVAGLAAQQNNVSADQVSIPSSVRSGRYWLGLCIDSGLDEISQLNNCFTPLQVTVISNGALTVLTSTLHDAVRFGTYGVQLQASGGDGSYAWSLTGGALPAGLTLRSDGLLEGLVAGPPASYAIDLTVTSSGASVSQRLVLVVRTGDLPLSLVSQTLPAAPFGRPYFASLIAVGGTPPYEWSASGELPAGLALSRDGQLEGRATTERGAHAFNVTVVDSAGASASRAMSVTVVEPRTLAVATTALPVALLNREYSSGLSAVGGKAPYTWALTRFQQLAETPSDVRGPELRQLPAGFGLAIENGSVLRGAPATAGLFSLTFTVTDSALTTDSATVLLLVSYTEPLVLTSTELPDAFINQAYSVKLAHSAPRAAAVTFSSPCIREATRPNEPYTCANADAAQQLPLGLALMADGTLSGRPTGATGTYGFLVKVADVNGRQDTRGLSIRVRPDFARPSGCASVEGPALIAALVLLVHSRRRR